MMLCFNMWRFALLFLVMTKVKFSARTGRREESISMTCSAMSYSKGLQC